MFREKRGSFSKIEKEGEFEKGETGNRGKTHRKYVYSFA